MAWLEGLASKHGAKAEELVTDPNARSEVAPEWVDKARAIGEPPEQPAVPKAESPEDETGLWLKGLREQEGGTGLPDWLSTLDEPAAAAPAPETSEAGGPTETEAPGLKEAVPDWLEGLQSRDAMTAPPAAEPELPPAAVPESNLPDWLSGLDKETPVGAAGDELPGWLAAEAQADASLAEPTRPGDWKPIDEKEAAADEGTWQPEPERFREPVAPPQPVAESKPTMEVEKAPAPAARPRTPDAAGQSRDAGLEEPRAEMARGNIAAALENYGRMIRKGKLLEEIIYDLREAIYRYPVEVSVWQALGDAYMRANRLQEALDAYTKAEELLR
jgi:hypothetical protein